MDELIEQFVIEGRELVQQASDDLLALEREPGDLRRLDGAFRAIHTLKGSAGIFDMAPMGRALHAAEDLLGVARTSGEMLSRTQVDAVLDVIGRCDEWVEVIAATGGALPAAAEAESARLVAALAVTDNDAAATGVVGTPPAWLQAVVKAGGDTLADALAAGCEVTGLRYMPVPDCFFLGDDPLSLVRAIPDLVALRISAERPPPGELLDPFRCQLVIEAASAAAAAEVRAVFRFVVDQVEYAAVPASATTAQEIDLAAAVPAKETVRGGTLRVAAAHVDDLISSIAELGVARNSLDHCLRQLSGLDLARGQPLAEAMAAVGRQVAEIHYKALRLRLVPFGQIFNRLPRLVRETAAVVGKQVVLALDGEAVEVDKAIADALFEPLLHLVRNALDHGIEEPDARIAGGKPPAGEIRIRAERIGDKVAVTVSDDGGGVDVATVRETAVRRGLLDRDAAGTIDEAGVLDLLFAPGFSTTTRVTDVSGRGVGLDAVRASICALGGSVVLNSEPGRGCAFRLILPQRTAIVPVLVVNAGGQRWGLMAEDVAEVLRLPPNALLAVHHGQAFVHRDRTLPVLNLARLLGWAGTDRQDGGGLRILVIRSGQGDIGLEVEGVEGRQDLMLRPVEGLLAATPALVGTAVLGDGHVLIVLDLAELVA